jgi:hypothetical protein
VEEGGEDRLRATQHLPDRCTGDRSLSRRSRPIHKAREGRVSDGATSATVMRGRIVSLD